jgi:protein involved in polysaccharide export with SLBB domain
VRAFAFAAAAVIAFTCAVAATAGFAAPLSSSFKEVAPSGVRSSLVPDDYRIGPQDTLDVAVFQVPDLSKTIRVDSGGDHPSAADRTDDRERAD